MRSNPETPLRGKKGGKQKLVKVADEENKKWHTWERPDFPRSCITYGSSNTLEERHHVMRIVLGYAK
jgi:hypothetical protein